MCGGSGGGGSEKLAQQAADQEQARQDRIAQGMKQLQLIFEGGKAGLNPLAKDAALDPNATYYDAQGNVAANPAANWTRPSASSVASPTVIPAPRPAEGLAASPAARPAANSAAARNPYVFGPEGSFYAQTIGPYPRQVVVEPDGGMYYEIDDTMTGGTRRERVEPGTQISALPYASVDDPITGGARPMPIEPSSPTILGGNYDPPTNPGGLYGGYAQGEGFNPDYFNKAYQAQLDYALPQVDRQYADAQKQLTYALARQGLSVSSQAGNLQGRLQGERDLAVQGEQEKATAVKQRQQQAVEDERATLTQLLQQTGDAESTANMARTRASNLRQAPPLETVGPLFQNVTGTLADMIVSPALRAQAGIGSYGYGKSSKGSGKVVS